MVLYYCRIYCFSNSQQIRSFRNLSKEERQLKLTKSPIKALPNDESGYFGQLIILIFLFNHPYPESKQNVRPTMTFSFALLGAMILYSYVPVVLFLVF
jgi:hypothetical protein